MEVLRLVVLSKCCAMLARSNVHRVSSRFTAHSNANMNNYNTDFLTRLRPSRYNGNTFINKQLKTQRQFITTIGYSLLKNKNI